jgi:hypothetical protein
VGLLQPHRGLGTVHGGKPLEICGARPEEPAPSYPVVVVAATTTEGAGSAGYLIRVVGIVLVLILWSS